MQLQHQKHTAFQIRNTKYKMHYRMILNTICNQNANSLHKSLPPLQTMHPLQKYFADVDNLASMILYRFTALKPAKSKAANANPQSAANLQSTATLQTTLTPLQTATQKSTVSIAKLHSTATLQSLMLQPSTAQSSQSYRSAQPLKARKATDRRATIGAKHSEASLQHSHN